jgi:hypothetical protein
MLAAVLFVDAGLQALGAYLLVSGLIPREVYLRDDPGSAVVVLPQAYASGGGGLRVSGSF